MTFDVPALPHRLQLASLVVLSLWTSITMAADAKPTPIADVKRDGPVSFDKDIQPILKKNCTACHNNTKAAGELSLETPAAILKGGSSGPAAIVKQGAESLLVTRSAVAGDEQMPPAGNKVDANRLTPTELGLLKLWIDQGAMGSSSGAESITWQPLPAGVHPIFAVALTADGQYAACSRANQIFVYHVPTGRMVSRLTDPALASGKQPRPGVADIDLVHSLAFSPDGQTLASGGFRTIKLWNRTHETTSPLLGGKLPTATTLAIASSDSKWFAHVHGNNVHLTNLQGKAQSRTLSGHTDTVTAIAFSADGTKLLTASNDKSARLWNTRDGSLAAVFEAPTNLTSATITNDGTTGVVGTADGKCRSFAIPKEATAAKAKLTTAQEWPSMGKRVTALAPMMGNATQIVVGDDGGNVVIWDVNNTKTPIKAMERTGGELRALAVAPNGAKIVGLDVGNAIRVWNVADGKPIAEIKGNVRAHRQAALAERAVAVAKSHVAAEKLLLADAEKLAVNESEAAKKAQDAKVTALKEQKDKSAAAKTAADAKASAEKAAAEADAVAKKAEAAKVAAESALAAAVEVEKGAKDPKAAAEKTKAAREAVAATNKAAGDASTKAKAALAAIDKTIKPFEDTAKALLEADSVVKSADRAIASATVASKRAADAIPVAKKRVADAEARQKKAETEFEAVKKLAVDAEKPFRSLAFSPDGKWFAAGGEDTLVHTFDAESATAIDVLPGQGSPVVGVLFLDNNRVASIGASGTALVRPLYPQWAWTRTIGDPASTELLDRVTALDFSPNGQQLASGGGEGSRNGELKIWNPATGKLLREIRDAHSDTVYGVRFSPDGASLASCSADKFLKTFEVASGKLLKSFEGHTHHVLGVDWSADGRLLVTAGADNAVKSWDVHSGEQKKTTPGFTKEVTTVAFVGATTEVVAASGDKTVRMLKADVGQMGKQFAGADDFQYSGAISRDGKVFAAGGKDGVLRIWDIATGNPIKSFALTDLPPEPSTKK